MKYVFCLAGYTGSGNDIICNIIHSKMNIPIINTYMYTNKVINSTNSRKNIIYISEKEFDKKVSDNLFFEYRTYFSAMSLYKAGTPKFDDINAKAVIMSVSIGQLRNICAYLDSSRYLVIPIFINTSITYRLHRLIELELAGDFMNLDNETVKQSQSINDKIIPPILAELLSDIRLEQGYNLETNFPKELQFDGDTTNDLLISGQLLAKRIKSFAWCHSKTFNGLSIDQIKSILDKLK